DGRTALHYAAQNGYADTCKLLIEKGCDLDCQDAVTGTCCLKQSAGYRVLVADQWLINVDSRRSQKDFIVVSLVVSRMSSYWSAHADM
ncbi:hypothetical protein BaRGS_00014188, partial [Batillaria attramentaria]